MGRMVTAKVLELVAPGVYTLPDAATGTAGPGAALRQNVRPGAFWGARGGLLCTHIEPCVCT
jgi:hypothetical protein